MRNCREALRDERAQDLMEYSLLMFLIVVVALAAVRTVGSTINSVFWEYIADKF